MFSLDPQPFQIALDNAKARLASAAMDVESMKSTYKQLLSGIDAQKSQVALAQHNLDRVVPLLKTHFETQAAYDQAHFTLTAAQNTLDSLQHQAQTQLAKLSGNPDIADANHPEVMQAQATSTRLSAS